MEKKVEAEWHLSAKSRKWTRVWKKNPKEHIKSGIRMEKKKYRRTTSGGKKINDENDHVNYREVKKRKTLQKGSLMEK